MYKKRSAAVILPTFNEKENIGRMLFNLKKVFETISDWDIDILVVDDKSPDGTAEVVREYQKKYSGIYLIEGEKLGLGRAYVRGFRYVLDHLNSDYVFEMDADFQHDPKDIVRFLEKAQFGYDFIIGSRYIPGGDIPSWDLRRKIYSFGANLLARYIAGIREINDCTSGFRCISTRFLRSFDFESIKASGYAFQMSLLHAAIKRNVRIVQIPILFLKRANGASKLGKKDIFEFFINAFKLRLTRYTEDEKYN